MIALWQWVSGNKLASLLMAGLLLLMIMHLLDRHSITQARIQIAQCRKESGALEMSNASLLAALKEQNAAIAALEKESNARQLAVSRALQSSAQLKQVAQTYAQSMVHDAGKEGEECTRMKQILAGYLSHKVSVITEQTGK